MNCVPDIFSMVEWSNWLTPFNSKRRYDTIFYLVSLEEKPHVLSPDLTEVSELIVSSLHHVQMYKELFENAKFFALRKTPFNTLHMS